MGDETARYDVPTPKVSIESVLRSIECWPEGAAEAVASIRAAFAFAATSQAWFDPDDGIDVAKLRAALAKGESAASDALQQVLEANLTGATTDPRVLKFPVLLLLSTVQACLSSASAAFPAPKGKRGGQSRGKPLGSHAELEASRQALFEAEVYSCIGVQPVRAGDPFVEAFALWIGHTFATDVQVIYQIARATEACREGVFGRFDAYFRGDSPPAAMLRDFLAVGRELESLRTIGSLNTLEPVLTSWITAPSAAIQHQRDAWERHINHMKKLPDNPETMFNEAFGVRRVFQPPIVRYHVNGRRSGAGSAETIEDIGRLFGALITNRVSSQDLIVVSGGPGSGKSTLCRFLASKMAATPGMHPVFLKLRKAKDGTDVASFIEKSLKEKGLVDRLADLWSIPNLVLILDGFDELVMSSRSQLRRFFNILGDELREGPLGHARVIVSGRDTLFPGGAGLPLGSHIVSLQPFDRPRVAAWGDLWRREHKTGPGSSFRPERLMHDDTTGPSAEHPLTHLLTWPLTLHLIAQIHTAGRLKVDSGEAIEKAYLYRSILKETAVRQQYQTDGEGRMDAGQLQKFLRSLAWEMYQKQTDSMDPVEVEPLLKGIYGDKQGIDLAELAEVAIVNAPELTKGDETGFEFVHKSFAEFLVAEHVAELVERVIFKAAEWGINELTWHKNENEAADLLAPALAIRPLPQEVQEMLEPMLGVLAEFSKGTGVGDDIEPERRYDGLRRIVERFERLYVKYVNGDPLDTVTLKGREHKPPVNPLEAYANYGLGIVLIGAASARRLAGTGGDSNPCHFQLETGTGVLARYLSILQAGGIVLDRVTAGRLFKGGTVRGQSKSSALHEAHFPMPVQYFGPLHGYAAQIPRVTHVALITSFVTLLYSVINKGLVSERLGWASRELVRAWRRGFLDLVGSLGEVGFVGADAGATVDHLAQRMELIEIEHLVRPSTGRDETQRLYEEFVYEMRDIVTRGPYERYEEDEQELLTAIDAMAHRFEYASRRSRRT